MTSPGVNIATAYVTLIPTAKGIQGNVAQIFAPAETEADKAGERSGTKFAASAAKWLVSGAAVAAVGGAFKKLFDIGSVFDDVSDQIRVGTGKSGAALGELTGIAETVGKTVPADFTKAGDTVTKLSQRMGLTGDTLTTVSEQFLEAGRILGSDVDISAATKALNGFGIQGDATVTAMDTLFRVSQSTGVGINELTAAAAAQAPALQELGFNFEDTVALVGSLDKAGINSTAVMASMSKGLVTLAKDGEKPQEAYQRVTGKIQDLIAEGKNAEAIDLASTIFGTRGATQFVGAVQSGVLGVDALNAATLNTGDTILGVAKETSDFGESWTLFKNKALAALKPAGDAVFSFASAKMGAVSASFDTLLPKVQQVFGKVSAGASGLAASVAPALKEIGGRVGAGLGDAWESLKPAISGLLPLLPQLMGAFNPVGLLFKALQPILPQIADVVGEIARVLGGFLAKALTAVTPLLQTVVGVFDRLLPFVTRLIEKLLPPLVSLFDSLAPVLDAVLGALVPVIDMIVGSLTPVIEALMPVVERVFGFIADTIGNFVQVVQGVIDVITGIFTGDWSKVWEGVKKIFGGIWDQIVNILSTALDLFVEFFTNLGPRIWDIIVSIASTVVGWGSKFLGWLWDGIKAAAVEVWAWFGTIGDRIWEKISALWGQVVGFGKSIIGWIVSGLKDVAAGTWDFLAWIGSKITGLFTGIYGLGKTVIGWIVSGLGNVAAGVWDFAGWIWDKISAAFGNLLEFGKKIARKIWEGITSFFGGAQLNIEGTGFVAVGANDTTGATGGLVGRLPSYAAGGLLGGTPPGDPRADNLIAWGPDGPLKLRSREFIQPQPAVDFYGVGAMAAIQNRRIPRELLQGYATGGMVSGTQAQSWGWAGSGGLANSMANLEQAIHELANTPRAVMLAGGDLHVHQDDEADSLEDKLFRLAAAVS